jgi:hypothetical protein
VSRALGYYLWPPVWVGEPAFRGDNTTIDVSRLNDEVYRATLPSGVSAKVDRQGLFKFDFSQWEPYQVLLNGITQNDPREYMSIRLLQVQVLHAHLACFYSAVASE